MAIPQARKSALGAGLRVGCVLVWPEVLDLRHVRRFHPECVRLSADTSISGLRVARELDGAIVKRARVPQW